MNSSVHLLLYKSDHMNYNIKNQEHEYFLALFDGEDKSKSYYPISEEKPNYEAGMNILKLKPFIADNPWGGMKLRDEFDIESEKSPMAEAWVLSCHPKGQDVIVGGEFDGRTLEDVLNNEGKAYLGENCAKFEYFPILIKLIDALDNLSIQVHPDDDYAMKNEGQFGKTECWYILEAEDGAEIIYGLDRELSREELRKIIENGTICDYVNHIKVKPGELYYIPAGTIHAICKGILLAEVQQNSDLTYRIYDYDRLYDGEPRELHKKKAGDVISLSVPPTDGKPQGEKEKIDGGEKTLLVKNELFTTSVVESVSEVSVTADKMSFVSLVCLDGNGVVEKGDTCLTFYKGESVFLPAGIGEVKIRGEVKFLETRV